MSKVPANIQYCDASVLRKRSNILLLILVTVFRLRKSDLPKNPNSKAKMKRKMGCLYVAEVYSEEDLGKIKTEKVCTIR